MCYEQNRQWIFLFETLLNAGQDPPLDTANQVPFKNARSLLYKVYPQEISDY